MEATIKSTFCVLVVEILGEISKLKTDDCIKKGKKKYKLFGESFSIIGLTKKNCVYFKISQIKINLAGDNKVNRRDVL